MTASTSVRPINQNNVTFTSKHLHNVPDDNNNLAVLQLANISLRCHTEWDKKQAVVLWVVLSSVMHQFKEIPLLESLILNFQKTM